MKVTEAGMLMEVNLLQPRNAPYSILLTEFGIITSLIFSHQINAARPIFVTEFGIVIVVKAVQYWNVLNIDYQ